MNTKKELTKFFTWLRNGICFAVTWFLILDLISRSVAGAETIRVEYLVKLVLWTSGGVLIFCTMFTELLVKKLGFTARLSIFMGILTLYELAYFHSIGILTHLCSCQLLLFLAIIIPSYLISLGIYFIFRKKKGELYTNSLHKYQQERKAVNEQ